MVPTFVLYRPLYVMDLIDALYFYDDNHRELFADEEIILMQNLYFYELKKVITNKK